MIDDVRFARLLTDYCLEVAPGQQVLVESSTLAAPLLLALQREILERDAWPLIRASLPGQGENFWHAARDRHLDGVPSSELAEAEQIDASLRIQATENANALAGVDPARLSRAQRARSRCASWCSPAAGRSRCTRPPPRPSRPTWARASSPTSSPVPCSSTATIPRPRGASCARSRRP